MRNVDVLFAVLQHGGRAAILSPVTDGVNFVATAQIKPPFIRHTLFSHWSIKCRVLWSQCMAQPYIDSKT